MKILILLSLYISPVFTGSYFVILSEILLTLRSLFRSAKVNTIFESHNSILKKYLFIRFSSFKRLSRAKKNENMTLFIVSYLDEMLAK